MRTVINTLAISALLQVTLAAAPSWSTAEAQTYSPTQSSCIVKCVREGGTKDKCISQCTK